MSRMNDQNEASARGEFDDDLNKHAVDRWESQLITSKGRLSLSLSLSLFLSLSLP